MSGCAWVTLATNDSYALGALVLAHSLRKSNTVHKLVVLITPALSPAMRKQLESVFDLVKLVNVLDSKDEAHLALMKRPELGITFTKIHCWRLTEFEKCVFLDADTLVVRNCDELFEREEFSAAPDVSWPDCFNSGVFVYKPSDTTFHKLLEFAAEKGSFDGGDQGLLNQFFSDWATEDIKKHLPFVYNLTTVAAYSYIPAFKQYGSETRIVHFIGTGKPWLQQFDPATKTITPTSGSEHLCPLLQEWWNLFCEKVHPDLDKSLEIANGMSHPPVEVSSNSIDVDCNDEPDPPCLLEPQTPYREKNDFRQFNLPYQPFDVKDSSGELLNIKFFTASVVPPPPPSPVPIPDEQQRQPREWEKEEENNHSEDNKKEAEGVGSDENRGNEDQFQKPDGGGTNENVETEKEEEKPQEEAPKGPFDYGSFFPDETCIDNYLQQNVITYQPFGTPHHDHSNHNQNDSNNNNSNYEGDNNDSNSSLDQGNQNISPPLPRFLTIPEDDQRQRGNEEKCASEEREYKHAEETVVHHVQEQPKDEDKPRFDVSMAEISKQEETFIEKRELHKSKSMGHLVGDAGTSDSSPRGSIWKSQSNVNMDPNRKYSMPKLKPILPKQNSKSVLPSIPKVTLYTEFLMSSEYKDPEDLPKDKIGFVESHLRHSKESHLKRSKSDADINRKFGPLPYSFTTEEEKTRIPKQKILFRRLDNDSGLYDLSQCKRQQGNKPKPKESREKKENNVLPALKPLIPSKDKKSVKKRKSTELSLSPGDGEREKRVKQERKRGKERGKKSKPSSVSKKNVKRNTDSVDDILKRLYDFSKDYQHYFGDVRFTPQSDKIESRTKVGLETTKTGTYINANVQDMSQRTPNSEQNSKIFGRISSVTTTGSEGAKPNLNESFFQGSERKGSTTKVASSEKSQENRKTNSNSNFKKFRSYLKDQTETTLKGLLDIPKIMSDGKSDESKIRKSGATVGMSSLEVVKAFGSYKPSDGITKSEVSVSEDTKPDSRSEDIRKGAKKADTKEDDTKVSGVIESVKEGLVTTSTDEVAHGNKERSTSDIQSTSSTVKAITQTEDEARPKPVGPNEVESVKESSSNKDLSSDTSVNCEVLNGNNFKQRNVGVTQEKANVAETRKTQDESKVIVINGGGHNLNDHSLKMKDHKIERSKKLNVVSTKKPEPLCVPDFDTPRSSRVWVVAPNLTQKHSQVTEIVEEIITKATSSAVLKETVVSREKSSTSSTTLPAKPSKVSRTSVKSPDRKSKSSPDQSKVRPSRNSMSNGTKSSVIEKQNGVNHQVFADYSPDETANAPDKNMAAENRPPVNPLAKFSVSPHNSVDGSDCSNNGQETSATLEDRRWASGIAGALAQLNLESGAAGTKQQTDGNSTAYPEYLRRQNWETGNMDYMGRDSFDNIWSKICQTLEGKMLEISGESSEAPSLDNSVPAKIIPAQDVGEQPGKEEQPVTPVVGSEPKTAATTTTTTEVVNGGSVPENPEYMDTLPGSETSQGPAEEDEIIFTKPENRQTHLTNIVEEEEADMSGSKVPGNVASQSEGVKLSDILKPGLSIAGEDMKNWALVKRPDADKLQVVEVPKKPEQKADGPSETAKTKLSKVASLREAGKPQEDVVKEAIPLPDVQVRGDQEPSTPTPTPQEAKEPLPEEQATETQSGSESSNGKQKKGVFSKILEIVGVSPKAKKESEAEVSKSVFYDVEGAAISKGQVSEDSNVSSKPPGNEKPMPEATETTETKNQVPVGVSPVAETAKTEVKPEQTVPSTDAKPQEDKKSEGGVAESQVMPRPPFSGQVEEVKKPEVGEKKTEEPKPEIASTQPQQPKQEVASKPSQEAKDAQPQEPDTAQKGAAVPKPARKSSSPSEKKPEEQKPADPAVPSQPLGLSVDPTQKPEIILTMPTPPVLPDVPKISGDSILGPVQPVIPEEKEKEGEEGKSSGKGKVMSEVDEILGKAKSEVESRLHEVDSKISETKENLSEAVEGDVKDLINTMKLIVGDDQKAEETDQSGDQKGGEGSESVAAAAAAAATVGAVAAVAATTDVKSGAGKQPGKQAQGKKPQKPQQKKKEEIEELKVTSEEERKKHKAQATSSKLSDQILKAIPPPRRKAISDSKAETSSSTGAIPKTPLEAAAAAVSEAGQSKDIVTDKPAEGPSDPAKPSKPSSIPVPPPRNKPKPGPPTQPPQKGKTKK